ncbi:TetR/AcrR family transcriptional regulator [Xanthobacter sp.]|uniref:TetR/AcrR family transcriptional regulator n=1 Tax=Xanthobacter sp. TaxID=35809 RepID=UPI0025EEA3A6|nr:TetR/AcrR family transcriptional regulator [Xanthobacter sp.]
MTRVTQENSIRPVDVDGRKAARRPQQERSNATRRKLVRATIDLLCERGYASVTTPDIADRAGVSRGALQYHFAGKEEIYFAAIQEITDWMDKEMKVELFAGLPIAERVEQAIDQQWQVFGSADYVAALEIRLYERFNDWLHQSIRTQLGKVTETRDLEWVRLFADSPADTATVVRLRHMLLDTLRGFALRNIQEGPGLDFTPQLTLLKGFLLSVLQPGHLPAGRKQPR